MPAGRGNLGDGIAPKLSGERYEIRIAHLTQRRGAVRPVKQRR
jgi:predicted dinucleotide-binding enzyme